MTREELLKISKPILFNEEMVQALLEGKKTVTRRKIKLDLGLADTDYLDSSYLKIPDEYGDSHDAKDLCRYRKGDYIYVRETWKEYGKRVGKGESTHIEKLIAYKADEDNTDNPSEWYEGKWKPSIHMPKELARIFLKVTDVRVERVQDITEDGAEKEMSFELMQGLCAGFTGNYKTAFEIMWNNIYGDWDADPFVWVIEFERVIPE